MKKIICLMLTAVLLTGCGAKSVFKTEITEVSVMASGENQKYGWGLKKNKNAPPEVPTQITELIKKYGGIYKSDEEKTLYLTFDEGYEN